MITSLNTSVIGSTFRLKEARNGRVEWRVKKLRPGEAIESCMTSSFSSLISANVCMSLLIVNSAPITYFSPIQSPLATRCFDAAHNHINHQYENLSYTTQIIFHVEAKSKMKQRIEI